MKSRLTAALFASMIGGALLAIPAPASARSSFAIRFDNGNVALAYRDGWWDRHHHFHHWRRNERRWYSVHYRRSYHDWDHDRDRDYGRHNQDRDYRPH